MDPVTSHLVARPATRPSGGDEELVGTSRRVQVVQPFRDIPMFGHAGWARGQRPERAFG